VRYSHALPSIEKEYGQRKQVVSLYLRVSLNLDESTDATDTVCSFSSVILIFGVKLPPVALDCNKVGANAAVREQARFCPGANLKRFATPATKCAIFFSWFC